MRIAIAALVLTILGVACAQAQSSRWQFCAARYHTPIDNVQRGFSGIEILFSDGRTFRTRKTVAEWADCYCRDGFCECCEVDIARACAFVAHRNATTNDHLRIDPCEGR